ncbi:MAG: phosphate ABC transporter substrate-binding protein [Verrucomicrobiae bacterium]|jgi:phosphate transport system substrate-binding protein|nr:phosphate ABC transporter substrate-binding protein [Verrucomicrobiae bacterium]PAZ01872.1 MAG: phosphate-binding protein [Opitutae bacterium AMD-G3]
MNTTLKSLALLALTATAVSAQTAASAAADVVAVDAKIPDYTVTSGVSGNLNSVGSDTLNNLMTFWSEGFKAKYPNVNVQVEGKGSSTAPVALATGAAQVGPMSREMKSSEVAAFAGKFGHKPTKVAVAIDALAVFVHKDNPVKGLSLTQVDGIFSSTRKRGGQDVSTWGDAKMTGAFAGKTISAFGRNSASGTYGFFKETALKNGDYKSSIKEQPGSSSVVQGVAADLSAIGYSGIGYKTSGVKALALSPDDSSPFVEANYANCLSGTYPLARYLYVYVNKAPSKDMDKLTSEFMTFVLSKQGQEIVIKDGYFPLPAEVAAEGRASLKYYSAE